jgi:DNA-binding NtrC family response regulator
MNSQNSNQILIVDDEEVVRDSLVLTLKKDYKLFQSGDANSALEILSKESIDLVLLDIRLPGISGLAILNEIKRQWPSIEVIMLSAQNDAKTSLEATKLGAYDFIAKPYQTENLLVVCQRALEKKKLLEESRQLKEQVSNLFPEMIGQSKSFEKVKQMIQKVAKGDASVLITGETGTGKELVARSIHQNSPRKNKPFITINCGGIPAELLESELFGHEQGAFTSALTSRQGKFEIANGGTIFLDEIGNMPYAMQAKMLRVLQEKEIERVGSNKKMKIDVRVLSATNADLKKDIKDGKFREDLFHRLCVIPLVLPPLRERKEDIELLAHQFLEKMRKRTPHQFTQINREAMEALKNYSWPGNIRELEHLIERIVSIEEGQIITKAHLPLEMVIENFPVGHVIEDGFNLRKAVIDFEMEMINKARTMAGGNQTHMAKFLGINRTTLIAKMKLYGMEETE